jgi:tRNA(adenine34) deaminase
MTISHDQAMQVALEQARLAAESGDVPVGAVVVRNGVIIAARHNEREATKDPTAHAEVLALRDAAQHLGRWRLDDCDLVVTLEPCVMCAGAIINARVQNLVFGAADLKAGAVGSLYNLCTDPRMNHNPCVRGNLGSQESLNLLAGFFSNLRSK